MSAAAMRSLNVAIQATVQAAKAKRPEWRAAWFRDCDEAIARYDELVADEERALAAQETSNDWALPKPSRSSRLGFFERITGLPFGEEATP